MITALRIETDGSAERLTFRGDGHKQRQVLRALLGDTVDPALYHRRALLHVHGSGATQGLPFNPAAWALACAWRGVDLDYGLHGRVIVTGPGDGRFAPLDADLETQVRNIAAAVRGILLEWRTRRPAGEQAARAEILAAARYCLSRCSSST
ncbi:hypothetical protein ACWD01_33405 [Streptomyces sp. NPDC002835]